MSIVDNGEVDADRTFALNLSSPVNATIADAQGVGTIQNDDFPANSPGDDDTDKPRKETDEQRQLRRNTNQGNKDDVDIEGDVVEIHPEANPRYVVIANRHGLVTVILYGDAQQSAGSIKVGDYLEADGEKIHEQLFEATDVSVSRPGR